jgi:hypothetical protein
MTKEQILGVLRHTLTFLGGILVVRGWTDESTLQEIIGATSTLIGGIWSILSKVKPKPEVEG